MQKIKLGENLVSLDQALIQRGIGDWMHSGGEYSWILNSVQIEQPCTLIPCRNIISNAMSKYAKKKHMK